VLFRIVRLTDAIDDRLDGPAGEAGQIGVLPAFLHAGEGELHAADVRNHLEAVLAQAVAQVAHVARRCGARRTLHR
jgi:hypothetical protein